MASFEFFPSLDKKENDHKVLPRDRFNSYRAFHVDDSENNEDEKSKEVLECVSRSSVSKTGESLQIPFSNPDPKPTSSPLEIKKASSLLKIWEARSQPSSSSPKQYLINTEFLNDQASENDEIDCGSPPSETIYGSDSEEISKTISRDRGNELKQLADRKAVSMFSPRGSGHVQYILTNRSFERCLAIQEKYCDVNRSLQGSSVMNNWDKGNKKSFKKPRIEGNSTEEREGLGKAIVKESKEANRSSVSLAEMVNGWEEKRMKEEDSGFEEGKPMEIDEYSINLEEVTLANRLEEETESHNSRKNGKDKKYSQDDDETLKAENEEALGMIREAQVFPNCWDEYAMEDEEKEDWMSNMKPKIHLKALREQWEKEVRNQSSGKDDIRDLLERRPVSSVLASEFREKIDKILISRARKKSKVESTLVEEKEKEKDKEKEKEEEEEEEEEEKEEEDKKESLVECSARYQKKLEEDETVKVDLQNPKKMICDLKEEIKQLQREMFELKTFVKSCVEFKKSESLSDPLERNCYVCFQMPVVTLLYRCGHMYTCLKCASLG